MKNSPPSVKKPDPKRKKGESQLSDALFKYLDKGHALFGQVKLLFT